jgi:hypothetical protein
MDALQIEKARVIFRNFSGRETEYNRAGQKNFSVVIDDPEIAKELRNTGWNIRLLESKDGSEPIYILQVKINFDSFSPPKVNMVSGKNVITPLDAETIGVLDSADIKYVDLIINPYEWSVNGKSGISAYLKTMYAVIEEDVFASKYAAEEHPDEDELPFS